MTRGHPRPAPKPAACGPEGSRPVLVGEVLFDCFADGSSVAGGAPFNVAWHLAGLGLEPLLVTRVGDDAEGRRLLEAMSAWGMDTSAVQVDPGRPTGRVLVGGTAGAPSFEIPPDQAWDHVQPGPAAAALEAEGFGLIYHGTLAGRSEQTAATIGELRVRTGLPVFLDVNLRDPWWQRAQVERALLGTRWVKLNENELRRLGAAPSPSAAATLGEIEAAALALRARIAVDQVIVTLGEAGALVATAEDVLAGPAPVLASGGDAVGAGDAFSAVWIAGLLQGWPPSTCLGRALALAADVAGRRGAVSADRGLYRALARRWQGEPHVQ